MLLVSDLRNWIGTPLISPPCSGSNNVISAVKNYPALLVNGEIVVEEGATLMINGLAQIDQRILINAGVVNADIDVLGGLFIANDGIDGINSSFVSVDVIAAPAIASIHVWPTAGTVKRWSPVAGAFFRSIERK